MDAEREWSGEPPYTEHAHNLFLGNPYNLDRRTGGLRGVGVPVVLKSFLILETDVEPSHELSSKFCNFCVKSKKEC